MFLRSSSTIAMSLFGDTVRKTRIIINDPICKMATSSCNTTVPTSRTLPSLSYRRNCRYDLKNRIRRSNDGHNRCFASSSSSSSSSSTSSSSSSSLFSLPPASSIPSSRKSPTTMKSKNNLLYTPATIDTSPEIIRQQMAAVLDEYLIENSSENKRMKKDEIKLKQHEFLISDEGQRLLASFDNYILYDNKDDANIWAESMISTLEQQQKVYPNKPIYVGIHVGWNIYGKKREKNVTHLLSISFPNQPVICLHLYKMNCSRQQDEKNFPNIVRELLQLPYIVACGIHVNRYVARIKRYLHVIIPVRIEIDRLAMIMEPRTIKQEIRMELGYLDFFSDDPSKHRLPSLKLLCRKYLNVEIDGTIGMPHNVDYFRDPLPKKTIQYSTLDSYHYRLLCETMITMIQNDITMPQPSIKFQVGTKVKVYMNSRINHVAEGIIEYLGGVNGESIAFGEKMINHGIALVRLIDIYKYEAKPKFSVETYMLYGLQRELDCTLSQIYASELPIIPVDIKRLVRMDEVDTTLFKEPIKKIKKLSKSRLKKNKKKKLARRLFKQEQADHEAKLSNNWFV